MTSQKLFSLHAYNQPLRMSSMCTLWAATTTAKNVRAVCSALATSSFNYKLTHACCGHANTTKALQPHPLSDASIPDDCLRPCYTGMAVELATMQPCLIAHDSAKARHPLRQSRGLTESPLSCCYNEDTDMYIIDSIEHEDGLVRSLATINDLSSEEILLYCSTSPFAEAADFSENLRASAKALLDHVKEESKHVRYQARTTLSYA
eukprot:TRINITY_DN11702_c0_g1_i4.p2 TRINITY_DN11702_c0_g1~~TRINITY_DN11702_c0_g1_i4.p2  ORF type:complete len:206 (+),score=33.15 TRINITY_DN11702_c0_g1_i4:446-1063(+)